MNRQHNSPLVSVITVAYNSANTIEQAIKSVIGQTYTNIQYIIIDGGSQDGTLDILKRYQNISWVSEKDNGIYDAMNKGLKLAKGELISILNSDDWYEPTAVETMVNAYLNNTRVDIFHGLLRFINAKSEPDLIAGHYVDFLDRGMIEHPTCFIKKSLYEKVGEFDTQYRSAADYDWMLRARKAGATFLLMPQLITNFRRGGMSDSHHGFSEELLIKKRNKIISTFKYNYWKLYSKLLTTLKK